MPEVDLPVKNTTGSAGYFIESYCRPNDSYALTFTRVIPLSGELLPDFNMEAEVIITAAGPAYLRLVPYHFHNYTSPATLPPDTDTLYLSVTTPDKQVITARSWVPSQVAIDSAAVSGAAVTVGFTTSRNPEENFYQLAIHPVAGDSTLKQVVCYLDYSDFPSGSPVERILYPDALPGADYLLISLKRLTRECYRYQLSLHEANSTQQGNITTPVPLEGNINGALGIFTCYTEHRRAFTLHNGQATEIVPYAY